MRELFVRLLLGWKRVFAYVQGLEKHDAGRNEVYPMNQQDSDCGSPESEENVILL